MATILSFSTSGDPRRAMPRRATQAEVIVFPRTDIGALRRLSEPADAPSGGERATAPRGDDCPA